MSDRTTMSGKPVFTVPKKVVFNFDSRFDKKLLCDGITFTTGDACKWTRQRGKITPAKPSIA